MQWVCYRFIVKELWMDQKDVSPSSPGFNRFASKSTDMIALAFSTTSSLALFKSPNDVKSFSFAVVVVAAASAEEEMVMVLACKICRRDISSIEYTRIKSNQKETRISRQNRNLSCK